MQVKKVESQKEKKQFLEVVYGIYKDYKNWIAPLEKDIESVFDPAKNPVFSHGEAERWILLDDNKKAIGRVAAFINHKAVEAMEFPVGGMGFFECIDNEKAAFMLFETCKQWLVSKGMKGMDGPINFGERDRFWGLLAEGFTPPSYMENYNPPYYKKHFEAYGFQLYFEQFTYRIASVKFEMGRLEKIARWVLRKPDYTFGHLQLSQMQKFCHDFVTIYNAAWQKFENFKPVTESDIMAIFKDMKPIIIPEYIWFAYVEGKPAAF
ncbi:MAG: GNAT family N-acetyltransferase, partial [Bacteroidia bacterium]